MLHEVSRVRLHLLSGEEIEQLSVCEITTSNLYLHSLPHDNGVIDARLGSSDRRIFCSTCYNSMEKCPGHAGFLKLHAPIFHPLFLDSVLKVLRCVCFFCSSLLVEPPPSNLPRHHRKKYLQALAMVCKTKKTCRLCGGAQPKYTKKNLGIHARFEPDTTFEDEEERAMATAKFDARKAQQILGHAPEATLAALQFVDTHPRSMVLSTLLIMSPAVRPSVMISDGARSKGQDELTIKLADIAKINNQLGTALEMGTPTTTLVESLQANVAQYMSKDTTGNSQKRKSGGRQSAVKSIKDRSEGKFGQVRRYVMAKRCNRNARSVIGPDPTLDVDELGVPIQIAMSQTYPERVTDFNLQALVARVRNGAGSLAGAAIVDALNGKKINLAIIDAAKRAQIVLRPGMVVHRFLRDGDLVVFNRQPSLHQESMMAHRVKILPGKTFRLNLAVCKAYNADFDGDEMNLHCPQSLAAHAEMKELMHVSKHIVTPSTNRPLIAACQDTVIGAYLMTRKDSFFDRGEFMQLMMVCRYQSFDLPPPAIVHPRALWTGKQVFSHVVPPRTYLDKVVRNGPGFDPLDAQERTVVVRDGRLLCGRICKKTIGAVELGFVHLICQDVGEEPANQFLSDLQRLVVAFMRSAGFSIGLGDCILDAQTQTDISDAVAGKFAALKAATGRTEDQTFSLLQQVADVAGQLALDRAAGTNNQILNCIDSGAKGSNLNFAQIAAVVGQQVVNGNRILPAPQRTLPACIDFSDPTNTGFVANSYLLGLSAQEAFFHQMGGREGIIDTSIKTASTG